MKRKLFILLFFLLMIFPYSALFKATSWNYPLISMTPSNLQAQSEFILTNSKPEYAYNELVNSRWSEPLESKKVQEKLREYKSRALISFFSFEERDSFYNEVSNLGIDIEKKYNPIPAITISYNLENLIKIDFSHYQIKYVYPIGTKKYSIPQTIDIELGSRIELSDIRRALEIDALHDLNHTGYGVRIAVLDSGMNFSQAPSLVGLRNYDEQKIISSFKAEGMPEDINDLRGHGTGIASILSGNGKFIIDGRTVQTDDYGIAPDSQLLNIKVLDATGYGEDEWLIDGFALAIDLHSDIITASLTSITFAEIGDPMEELMYAAGRAGIIVVGSAGNYGPTSSSIGAPAIWDYVISVGATENLQDLAIYTSSGLNQNFSAGIDILAPGNSIGGSDASNGGYRYFSGTSVSAPIVSGILALLLQAYPNLKSHNYEVAIFETADDLNHPIVYQGCGLVNPVEALNFLSTHQNETVFTINPTRISPENLYFYECVEGKTTEFRIKIISSDDQLINTSISGDSQFLEIAEQFQVYRGWNHISFNISIPLNTPLREINAVVLFDNLANMICSLEISIQTRYFGGTILFDVSLDNDSASRWFDSSTPYGVYQYLARRLKDRGYHLSFNRENELQASDLNETNILIIADPEINPSTGYYDTVYNFVQGGGSLLFMINSIRFSDASDAETDPILSSNYILCNEILERFEASVGYQVPIDYIPYEATITSQAEMLDTDSFFFWGWPVTFNSSSTNVYNKVLATFTTAISGTEYNFNGVISTEIGQGRVMIFGSSYPFTDLGLLKDRYESTPQMIGLDSSFKSLFAIDSKNSQLVNDTFDWLVSKHRPQITIDWLPERILIREEINISFDILKEDGAPYLGNDTLNGAIIFANHTIKTIVFEKNGLNIRHTPEQDLVRYEISLSFDQYGWHSIYIPLKLDDHTPTDGRIDVFCDVALWDELALIKNISSGIAIFIIIAIVLIPLIRPRFMKEIT